MTKSWLTRFVGGGSSTPEHETPMRFELVMARRVGRSSMGGDAEQIADGLAANWR
jgi:hypothetical protein